MIVNQVVFVSMNNVRFVSTRSPISSHTYKTDPDRLPTQLVVFRNL